MWLLFYSSRKRADEGENWFAWATRGADQKLGHCELLLENTINSGEKVYQAYGLSRERNSGVAYKETRTAADLRSSSAIAFLVASPPVEKDRFGFMYRNTRSWYERNLGRQYQSQFLSKLMHCLLCGNSKTTDRMHEAEFASYCLQTTHRLGALSTDRPFFPKLYTVDSLYYHVNDSSSPAHCVEDTVQLLNRMS